MFEFPFSFRPRPVWREASLFFVLAQPASPAGDPPPALKASPRIAALPPFPSRCPSSDRRPFHPPRRHLAFTPRLHAPPASPQTPSTLRCHPVAPLPLSPPQLGALSACALHLPSTAHHTRQVILSGTAPPLGVPAQYPPRLTPPAPP